jgi:hypothetical protein
MLLEQLTLIETIAKIVGALSVVVAIFALRLSWKLQHTIKAQDYWGSFIERAMQYPTLAYPPGQPDIFNYDKREIKIIRPENISDQAYRQLKRQEYERYEWFLSYLLKTARQMLDWFEKDEYWSDTIKRNFRYHAAYFSARKIQKEAEAREARKSGGEVRRDFVYCSGPKVNKLIDAVIEEHRRKIAKETPVRIKEEPAPAATLKREFVPA